MKKFWLFAGLALLLTGCSTVEVTVGSPFTPLREDALGRKFIYAPEAKQINYELFTMKWDEKAGFCLFESENTPHQAVWRSRLPDKENLSAFGTVYRRPCHLSKPGQEGLLEFAQNAFKDIPRTRIQLMEQRFDKITFAGQEAVQVYCVSKDTGKELYTIQTTIIFPCPENGGVLYFVAWSQRGRKADFRNAALIRHGTLFFESFALIPRE